MLTRRPPVCAAMAGDEPAAGAGTPAQPLLDPAALARLHELDPQGTGQLFVRVVQAFNTSSNRLLPQLRAAGQAVDLNGVRHVAHTLKSSSASLGATRLSGLCAQLEQQTRAGVADALDMQIERIAGEIAIVLQALNAMTDRAE